MTLRSLRFADLVILLCLLAVACRGKDDGDALQPSVPNTPQESSATQANGETPSGSNRRLAHPATANEQSSAVVPTKRTALAVDDPSRDGWHAEQFSIKVSKYLKQLSGLLEDGGPTPEWVGPRFRGALARPGALEQIAETNSLQVRRLTQKPEAVRNIRFEDWLLPLLSPVGGLESQVRVKTKQFHVALDGPRARTDLYFQLFAKHNSGTIQIKATWQCIWNAADGEHPLLEQITVVDYEEVQNTDRSAGFVDCTESILRGEVFSQQLSKGIDYWLSRLETRQGVDVGGWQGLAIADVNGDGFEDIYFCQPGGLPNRLYIQNADGTATESSNASGVDWLESSHAALFVDADNDGDQDLFVGVASGVLVMSNDGTGKFKTRAAMLTPAAYPYSITAADYDIDGDLDIYVCCYNRRQGINRHLLFARPVPYHDANNGGRNVLLNNTATPDSGKWRFRYATGSAGLDNNNRRFSYASAWEDYDNDGDMDLYVANDFGRNNLYQNQGNGTFRDVAADVGVEDIGPGMSSSWGDYNNDGAPDLYVSNMFSSAGNRITGQNQFLQNAKDETKAAFRRHARGNSLFLNQGDGTFADVSEEASVTLGRWAWGSRFADLNNDGLQDLIVTNGFITQADDNDL